MKEKLPLSIAMPQLESSLQAGMRNYWYRLLSGNLDCLIKAGGIGAYSEDGDFCAARTAEHLETNIEKGRAVGEIDEDALFCPTFRLGDTTPDVPKEFIN